MLPFGINLVSQGSSTQEVALIDHMRLHSEWRVTGNVKACYVPALQREAQYDLIVGPNVSSVNIKGATDGLPNVRKPVDGLVQFTAKAIAFLNIAFTADGPFTASMVPTEWRDRFDKGETLSPELAANTNGFGGIRFMDWALTNETVSQRASLSAETYNGLGMPVEIQAALCNAVGADMWTNVPLQMWLRSPTTVKSMLAAARKAENPSLQLKIEFSNEIWNTRFPHGKYALAQPGGPDDWYGVQVGKLAAMAPANSKIVLANQFAVPNRMKKSIAAYRRTTTRPFNIIACAPYMTPLPAVVEAAAAKGDVDMLLASLEQRQQNDLLPIINQWGALAEAEGVTLEAYEMGTSFIPNTSSPQLDAQMVLFAQAQAHPRTAALVAKHASDMRNAGFGMIHLFNSRGDGGRSGYWGLRSGSGQPFPTGEMALEHNDEAWRTNRRGWLGARA